MSPARPIALALPIAVLLVPAAAGAQAPSVDSLRVAWSGYVQLFGHSPAGGRGKFELYTLGVAVDAELTGLGGQRLGFHGLVRIRDTKLRPFYPSPVWAQEVYGWWDSPAGRLKLGKVYTLGGRFWDGSFFGNVHYFDGLKLDPDFGLSLEGERGLPHGRVAWAAQYLFDGDGLNGALADRDPETFPGVAERDQWRFRVVPAWRPREGIEIGIAGSYARKELEGPPEAPGETPAEDLALDAWATASVAWLQAELYAEVLDRDADDASSLGDPELEARYWLYGARGRGGPVEIYYNFSRGRYETGAEERIHQPGLSLYPSRRFFLTYEYDRWTRAEPGARRSFIDRSHNAVLTVLF